MKRAFFIYTNDVVSGPFTVENVDLGLQTGRWTNDSMIWWKGQREWIAVKAWKENINDILESFKNRVQRSVWYVEYLGVQKGPLGWVELKDMIIQTRSLTQIRLWTIGMKKWATVFEIPDVAKQLNVSRREYPRAPIQGEVFVKRGTEELICHAAEIGEGGLGIKNAADLNKGDIVYVTLKSPLLINHIQSKATVVYTAKGGYTGLQFENIHVEAKSTIIDYVRQFSSEDTAVGFSNAA